MNMVDCKILIKNENKIKAMEAIKELVLNTDLNWVDFQTVTQEISFENVMRECRWAAETKENGDVIYISFCGEKLGSEDIIFDKIAPYVKKIHFIEITGEGDERWRWFFDGKNCRTIYSERIWNEKENNENILQDNLLAIIGNSLSLSGIKY